MKNYSAILTETTKKVFYDYIDCLHIPQIDYFAIGIQNFFLKKSISLMSNPEWQSLFAQNDFAEHDPLRKATIFTRRNIIPFDEIDHCDSFGKEIMRQRSRFDIKKGIVLMERKGKYNYMLTLGTSFSRFDAYQFLKSYHNNINVIKSDFIKIIEKDSKDFILSAHT